MLPRRAFTIAVLSLVACLPHLPCAAQPPSGGPPAREWPGTAAARHAKAWFEAFNAGEAAMRAMYPEHYSPGMLESRPIDARLTQYRQMRERQGTLTPVMFRASGEDAIRVRARNAAGDLLSLEFECEPEPPHRIRGIRIEAGEEPPVPAGPPLGDHEATVAMREILTRAARADSFSGAFVIARDGQPIMRDAWGAADRRFGAGNGIDTRFNLGSITKLFTKVAIAQLAHQGRLSLDDPLTKWIPDWPGRSASKITVAMLAEHRAGIPDVFGPRFDAMDRSRLRHNRDYLALFRDQPLWFEPGTSRRYSNGSYVLLGEIIAKASGQDYYDYLRDHVWGPSSMTASGCFEADEPTPGVAMGYTRGEAGRGPVRENVHTRPARGSAAGGCYSTLEDLLRFDTALLSNRLCPAGWTEWVLGGPPPSDPKAAAAGGGATRPGFGFAGGAPGISAEYVREGTLTLIVLANQDPPLTQAVTRGLAGILRRMRQ